MIAAFVYAAAGWVILPGVVAARIGYVLKHTAVGPGEAPPSHCPNCGQRHAACRCP